MTYQAVELQGRIAMEYHHHTILWPLDKHLQRLFYEHAFTLDAVHAVAE
jgi:hypothetical protein